MPSNLGCFENPVSSSVHGRSSVLKRLLVASSHATYITAKFRAVQIVLESCLKRFCVRGYVFLSVTRISLCTVVVCVGGAADEWRSTKRGCTSES